MELILLGWLIGAAFTAWVASQKGRSGFAWFLLAILFSPLLALIAVAAAPAKTRSPAQQPAGDPNSKVCPKCAEPVKRGADVCRFCGYEFRETTDHYRGYDYTVLPDGSVKFIASDGKRKQLPNVPVFKKAVDEKLDKTTWSRGARPHEGVKRCPQCEQVVPLSASVCRNCSYTFKQDSYHGVPYMLLEDGRVIATLIGQTSTWPDKKAFERFVDSKAGRTT